MSLSGSEGSGDGKYLASREKENTMPQYRRMLRRRAILYFISGLMLLLFLVGWMIGRKSVPPGRVISYNQAPDHILVQLAELPEPVSLATPADPEWTLYGNGTLIFETDPSETLWRAQLAASDIQPILNVIINQNTFFSSTQQRYGSIVSNGDVDQRLLTVDVNGRQKQVLLVGEPTNQMVGDLQTRRMFAIEQFLLTYHPVHSVFYASNSGTRPIADDD